MTGHRDSLLLVCTVALSLQGGRLLNHTRKAIKQTSEMERTTVYYVHSESV